MSSWRRYAVIAPVSAIVAFAVASCKDTKVSQCQRLIEAVNRGSSLVEQNKGKQAETTFQLADDLDGVTKAIARMNLGDTELKEFQNRFVKEFEALSQAIALAGKALDSASTAEVTPAGRAKLEKAKGELEKSLKAASLAAKQADTLAVEVNIYCGQELIVKS